VAPQLAALEEIQRLDDHVPTLPESPHREQEVREIELEYSGVKGHIQLAEPLDCRAKSPFGLLRPA